VHRCGSGNVPRAAKTQNSNTPFGGDLATTASIFAGPHFKIKYKAVKIKMQVLRIMQAFLGKLPEGGKSHSKPTKTILKFDSGLFKLSGLQSL